jgi:hypothetical protein
MRLKIGGKLGPVRAGVSVGRSGVGWGAGAGPIGVTGGTGSRSKGSRSSGFSQRDESSGLGYQPVKNEHPEDSWGALLAYYGPLLLGLTAISTVFFDKPDRYGTVGFRPPIAYWLFLIGSIALTLVGVLIMFADRRFYKRTGRFRPTVFSDRKGESTLHKKSAAPKTVTSGSAGKGGLLDWAGLAPVMESEKVVPQSTRMTSDTTDDDIADENLTAIQEWVKRQPRRMSTVDEDLIVKAIKILHESGIGSTSLLQRKLKVGFARSVHIMDELEGMGVVGPADGATPRSVLLNISDLDRLD